MQLHAPFHSGLERVRHEYQCHLHQCLKETGGTNQIIPRLEQKQGDISKNRKLPDTDQSIETQTSSRLAYAMVQQLMQNS